MKHFVVCRRREVREFITVAAEDEEEARERAQETIDRVDEPDWSPDDQ